jgi:microcystin-dependent protein
MASVIFNNAQRIIKQIFDWLQSSGQTKTANFITDSFQTGIIPLELGEFSVVPGSNNTALTPTITIGSGVAYGPDSSRIIVASGDVTPYNAANPSSTTNDGLGNFLLTPQSTGVVNIPLTQSSQNYVWIQYLATIDTTAFTLNKETNAKQFYKQTDGYQITVTTTNVAPGANYVYLSNVNMLGGGPVTSSVIFITNRTYFQISENVVPITTAFNNRSNATTVYTENSTYTIEAHIKAIGTGTGQSPTNPHNMSLSDLGVAAFDTVQAHRQLEHGANADTASANAIIAGTTSTPYPTSSAMATSINTVNPGSDTINVFQLLATEVAIVNGSAFNVTTIFGVVPTNATVMFPDTTGTYNVYWDSVSKVFAVTTGSIDSDATKLWLSTVTYTFVGHGVSDHNALSSLIEKRRIGSTVEKYQRWKTTARPSIPIAGEFGFNVDTNSPEFFDGTTWQSAFGIPTGAMLDFAGASSPSGFLLCDGSVVSQTTFAALFAAIGTFWNTGGEGAGNFRLPNFQRRTAVGSGGTGTGTLGNIVGDTGGAESVTVVQNAHGHIGTTQFAPGTVATANGASWPYGFTSITTGTVFVGGATPAGPAPANMLNTSTTTATNQPSSVIQPSAIVTKIIKI